MRVNKCNVYLVVVALIIVLPIGGWRRGQNTVSNMLIYDRVLQSCCFIKRC
jgi:hypothetical protein